MVNETRKIMGDPSIDVSPTCVRVPVPLSHSESILIETERPVSPEQAREIWSRSPGVTVVDDPGTKPVPAGRLGRRQGRRLRRPHPPGPEPAQYAALLVRQRQPPQGSRHQRRPDRRKAPRARARPRLTETPGRCGTSSSLSHTTAPTSTAGSASRGCEQFSRSSKTP